MTSTRSAHSSRPPPAPRNAPAGAGAQLPGRGRRPGHRRRHALQARRAPDAVRLMTAHRSKGLQWRLVVVAGVQEGSGPTCAAAVRSWKRTGSAATASPNLHPGALLAEERRLFYVAATRARERLVVTAVKAPPTTATSRRASSPNSVSNPATSPAAPPPAGGRRAGRRAPRDHGRPAASAALRDAAAHRLARLAALTDEEGQPLVPAAHPYRWWGLYEPTRSAVPLRDRDHPSRSPAAHWTSSPTPAPSSGSWAAR
ncbi:3'-5' exonuclease [Streptomyces sp. M10(2022)]